MCLELSDDFIDELAMGGLPGTRNKGSRTTVANARNAFANGSLSYDKSLARVDVARHRKIKSNPFDRED